jgi:2-polyprenyl-3-methyl-5-hydroxy-6-metoxy-1,4-benzoquinol methylase
VSNPTLERYRHEALATRLHTNVRWRTCPFAAVAAHVPREGRVLEVGCGHGLLATSLALESPHRTVVGTDVDGDKIHAAQRATADVPNVTFEPAEPGELPAGPWDAVAIVDVLYLIDRAGERRLLERLADDLAPGGVLLVKEMATSPRWKFRWMALQERLAVQVLGITEGHDLTFVPPDELGAWLAGKGLEVEHHRLDRRSLHPHHLVLARKPSAPE